MAYLHPGAIFRDAIRPVFWAVVWCDILYNLRHADLAALSGTQGKGANQIKQKWDQYEWLALRVLGSLGTVTGMLLAFRSNSAMDRWNTGRRKWAEMQATSRSLVRLLSTALLSCVGSSSQDQPQRIKALRTIDETLALIPFFGIALMFQLRGEPLRRWLHRFAISPRILDHLPPRLLESFDDMRDAVQDGGRRTSGRATKQGELRRELNMLNNDKPASLLSRARPARDRDGKILSSHCALSTLVHLQTKLDRFHAEGQAKPTSSDGSSSDSAELPKLSGPVYAHSIGLLNSLGTQMTELERVRDTPIPLSLSLHFSRLLFVNTLLLPVVLVNNLPDNVWLCMAATALVTAMLYGIDSVSATLSQPFGTDKEDLPLERWCMDFEREWLEMQQSVRDAHAVHQQNGARGEVQNFAAASASDMFTDDDEAVEEEEKYEAAQVQAHEETI